MGILCRCKYVYIYIYIHTYIYTKYPHVCMYVSAASEKTVVRGTKPDNKNNSNNNTSNAYTTNATDNNYYANRLFPHCLRFAQGP